jgi:asparagine synthase (glutamine-hydrolysing)
MCGIAGFFDRSGFNPENGRAIGERMGQAIRHRGPDDSGVWLDASAGVVLSHRRLSILDLSPAGHQPMVSRSGRYVIIFNGEIYNHTELRLQIDASRFTPCASPLTSNTSRLTDWRGHSDTETLLAGFETWGIEATLKQAIGMFAIAVWDRQDRVLTLARDRMGEKPLYYGWQGNFFLFGSELKALKEHPAFNGEIDRDSLCLQLRHNYIPAPFSIYKDIYKLKPGHLLQLPLSIAQGDVLPQSIPYWSLSEIVTAGTSDQFRGNDTEAIAALDDLLRDAVGRQMMADVPLGAFLSGGIDSSAVVGLMQAQSSCPVKTFTIGFNEEGYNEAVHAKAVARHLGTDHTELYVTPQQARDVIPRLPNLYDEPFSDSSQIPTCLVSAMTRQHVTVSLSGDAGDELFGGYGRYTRASRVWGMFGQLPCFMRSASADALRLISVDAWNFLATPLVPFLPVRSRNVGDKLYKFAALLNYSDRMNFYSQFLSHWPHPEKVVLGAAEHDSYFTRQKEDHRSSSFYEAMMVADSETYLPGDVLVKVDRAAMSVSLETRVPFLDHRVVEFAWRLPLHMKVRNGQGKWILRQVLYKYVPKGLIDRPKMGFGVPIDSWLRGPLNDWAENLLDEDRLKQEGFFNPAPIRRKWAEHLSGQRNWQYHLWDVLMFQAWLEAQRNG